MMPEGGVSSTRVLLSDRDEGSTVTLPEVPARDAKWVSLQVEAMALAWERGERPDVESILHRNPGLGDESIIRLVYEDVCLRREAGEEVLTQEVLCRFPRLRDKLEVVMGCDRLLRPVTRQAALPNVGEELGPYRLLEELGRGASGKIFLAEEPALADRQVVLKVMPNDESEHLSLARLQHTHIVPLFSEQTFAERGLRALCMPYLGGTSLSRILEELEPIPPRERMGRDILDALLGVETRPAGGVSSGEGPYRRYLEQVSYVQAVCWITACLADALSDTHAHGLLHMDVKPSNVLVAGNGQAMLLDFHLARRPIAAGEMVWDRVGGTLAWMAPEHRAAMECLSLGLEIETAVDGRSDLYALGLLLCEALCGSGAAREAITGGRWWERNSNVSVGLRDIVGRCLAERPADRYQSAGELAEDLRLHLRDLPLKGVPNRSWVERWVKWRRSQPAALMRWTAVGVTAVALGVLGVGFRVFWNRTSEAIQEAVEEGRTLREEGRLEESARVLDRGLKQADGLLGVDGLVEELKAERQQTRRRQKAAGLHRLADAVRFRDGSAGTWRPEEARALVERVREIWKDRTLSPGGPVRKLSEDWAVDPETRADLFDLVETCGAMLVAVAPAEVAQAAKAEAQALMAEAVAAFGPRPAEGALQRGRRELLAGRFAEAAVELRKALDDRPHDLWPNFYEGVCAFRLGRFAEAYAAFRTCVALAPERAECYYNRAMALEAMGEPERAEHDYGLAVKLEPGMAAAWMNRGLLAMKRGRPEEAIRDLEKALELTPDEVMKGRIYQQMALAYLARGDRAEAVREARQALRRGNGEARGLLEKLEGKK